MESFVENIIMIEKSSDSSEGLGQVHGTVSNMEKEMWAVL